MPTLLADVGNPVGAAATAAGRARLARGLLLSGRMRSTALACGLALAACNTPSVPLPPPDLPAITITAAPGNLVLARGAPSLRHVNVRFYVLDQTSGDGVITTAAADGSFASRPFMGTTGDTVAFYYDTPDGERSDVLCALLQLDVGLISTRCH